MCGAPTLCRLHHRTCDRGLCDQRPRQAQRRDPLHANEAATKDGQLLPNTKTAAFKAAVHVPVYLPLSGKTMEFDAEGKCAGGC